MKNENNILWIFVGFDLSSLVGGQENEMKNSMNGMIKKWETFFCIKFGHFVAKFIENFGQYSIEKKDLII